MANSTTQKEVLLTEYSVCEQDNAANFQGYWTLAGIFIGVSSALLAGLIYGFLANESFLRGILFNFNRKVISYEILFGVIALILALANITILKKLKGWHRRILQNQRINSGRMREIELELGMSRSWKYVALDNWFKILKEDLSIETKSEPEKWDALKKELKQGLESKYHKKLEKQKDSILLLIKQYSEQNGKPKYKYVSPSSKKHYPCILYTLMSLWVFVIAAVVFLIVDAYFRWKYGLTAVFPVIIYSFYLIKDIKKLNKT
jgi:hypothetical protein